MGPALRREDADDGSARAESPLLEATAKRPQARHPLTGASLLDAHQHHLLLASISRGGWQGCASISQRVNDCPSVVTPPSFFDDLALLVAVDTRGIAVGRHMPSGPIAAALAAAVDSDIARPTILVVADN